MWTIKQANRTAVAMNVLFVALMVALGTATLVHGRQAEAATWFVFALLVGVAARWRPRSETFALLVGRANDERQAWLQLRIWAAVGQAYAALFAVLTIVAAFASEDPWDQQPWFLLIGVAGVVGVVAALVLRRRA
jgi:hypothetical protein